MSKKYYVNFNRDYAGWKGFLSLQEKDITEKIELQGLVYVQKNKIENIEDYCVERFESTENMDLEDASDYVFMGIEELTKDQVDYLENGYTENDMTEEQEQQLIKNIIDKMKKEYTEYDGLDTYLAYEYWDGSNWEEEILKHCFNDVEWDDYSEELDGMEEIDYEEYNTGNYTMYKTKEGQLCVVNLSYYQGSSEEIYFLKNNDYKTIDEAFDCEINKEEGDYIF